MTRLDYLGQYWNPVTRRVHLLGKGDGALHDLTPHLPYPSARGELEISDVNARYLKEGRLRVEKMGRGYAWLDTGPHEALLQANNFIGMVEARQGLRIACPEEIAGRMGFIGDDQWAGLAEPLVKSGYGQYLLDLLDRD